jgi:transposase
MQVTEHEALEQLRGLMEEQTRVREHRRFRAVVLAREGQTAPQIVRTPGSALRPVQRWIERYNAGGFAALAEGKHSGRPPRLSGDQEPAFRQMLKVIIEFLPLLESTTVDEFE